MAKACSVCGNHTLVWVRRGDSRVKECTLCGNLEGDPESVRKLQEQEESLERGIGLQAYVLIKAIEDFPGFKVEDASNGDPAAVLPPHVAFTVQGDHNDLLTRFLTSLGLANQKMKNHWTLEALLQTRFVYRLAPHFDLPVAERTPELIRSAISDLAILAENFERDARLYFWTRV